MPCATIIMRHFIPVLSIIADGIGYVLPRGATNIAQRSARSITTARNGRPISTLLSTLRRCVHLMSPPQAISHRASLAISNNPHS